MSRSNPIDLSYNLDPATPVYPGDPELTVEIVESTSSKHTDEAKTFNLSRIAMGTHCGTHMDAPFHFFENGIPIDKVPITSCVGKALLVDVRNKLTDGNIGVHHLRQYETAIREVRRIVLHSGWSGKWGAPDYFSGHPVLAPEAARWLVECGILMVGVDFPSVDRAPFPVHLELLANSVIIVENLTNLAALKKELFDLIVLPLKFTGRDGSPVRAIALEE